MDNNIAVDDIVKRRFYELEQRIQNQCTEQWRIPEIEFANEQGGSAEVRSDWTEMNTVKVEVSLDAEIMGMTVRGDPEGLSLFFENLTLSAVQGIPFLPYRMLLMPNKQPVTQEQLVLSMCNYENSKAHDPLFLHYRTKQPTDCEPGRSVTRGNDQTFCMKVGYLWGYQDSLILLVCPIIRGRKLFSSEFVFAFSIEIRVHNLFDRIRTKGWVPILF